MPSRPRLDDAERRRRLVARHHLRRDAADPVAAAEDLVAVHASDPLTPYLALRARVPGLRVADVEAALYDERRLWRLHAMRRTLWVVPTDLGPVATAAAGRSVAARERRRVEGWLAAVMPEEQVDGWVTDLEDRTVAALAAADGPRWTRELAAEVPGLEVEVTVGSGRWTARQALSSRVLFLLAMQGRIVRARPLGTWRASQYGWATTRDWFGHEPAELAEDEARTELARRYLARFGPVTEADLRWWTGWTAAQARAALRAVAAVPVDLAGGDEGWVLADDRDPTPEADPTAALLPGLDPTPMGWKDRGWYLGSHAEALFDRNGNVGPTVWWGGRIVGGWGQRDDGEVVHRTLEDLPTDAITAIADEAAELTRWLDGVTVVPRFRTPLERELSG